MADAALSGFAQLRSEMDKARIAIILSVAGGCTHGDGSAFYANAALEKVKSRFFDSV